MGKADGHGSAAIFFQLDKLNKRLEAVGQLPNFDVCQTSGDGSSSSGSASSGRRQRHQGRGDGMYMKLLEACESKEVEARMKRREAAAAAAFAAELAQVIADLRATSQQQHALHQAELQNLGGQLKMKEAHASHLRWQVQRCREAAWARCAEARAWEEYATSAGPSQRASMSPRDSSRRGESSAAWTRHSKMLSRRRAHSARVSGRTSLMMPM
mmetsp:Transcript_35321/g.82484  ORF Transcript_35321/g.82484 Transcript_35321/m.82484 type:complete len:213 (-) Transcript_35321:50-688(-)